MYFDRNVNLYRQSHSGLLGSEHVRSVMKCFWQVMSGTNNLYVSYHSLFQHLLRKTRSYGDEGHGNEEVQTLMDVSEKSGSGPFASAIPSPAHQMLSDFAQHQQCHVAEGPEPSAHCLE